MNIEAPKDGQLFEVNAFYERLIAMRQTNRKDFDSLSAVTHLALGEYERQKIAAEGRNK
jgi:hypothetical protein